MFIVDNIELAPADLDATATFFTEAFGWKTQSYGPTYTEVQHEGPAIGLQGDPAEQRPTPLVIIRTDDLVAAREAVEAARGVVTTEPFDFPGGRRFEFTEPSGTPLAIWCPTGEH